MRTGAPRPPLPHGPVPLEPEAAELLGRLAKQLGRADATTIVPGGPIAEAEEALQTAIPYHVLAVLAVEQRSLRDLFEITSEARTFYDTTESGIARRLGLHTVVLFARLPGEPAEPSYAGFDKATRRDGASIVRWVLRKPEVGRHAWSLAGYVATRGELPGEAERFALAIEAPRELVQYATHAKFGRGRVVSRSDGKAVVEFADGRRMVAEQFLAFES
jgi:hypothetical protein